MRPDNVHPTVRFKGKDEMHLTFKYPPTQEEYDFALAVIAEAMDYANKLTGRDVHIIDWKSKEES